MRHLRCLLLLVLLQCVQCWILSGPSGYNITEDLGVSGSVVVEKNLELKGFFRSMPSFLAACTVETRGSMRWNGRNYEVCVGAWQPISFCDIRFPPASQVPCLDEIMNSCNDRSAQFGTGLNLRQCLQNSARTGCDTPVYDDCGNMCGILGHFECGNANLTRNSISITGAAELLGDVVVGTDADSTLSIAASLLGATPLTFKGTGEQRTTFVMTEPSSERTIVFPDASGTVLTTGNLEEISAAYGSMSSLSVQDSVSVAGGLSVDGASNFYGTVQLQKLAGTRPLVFEGEEWGDGASTTLYVNPTRENMILLPDVSGTVITTGNLHDIDSSAFSTFDSLTVSNGLSVAGDVVLGSSPSSTISLLGTVVSPASFLSNVTLGASASDVITINGVIQGDFNVAGGASFSGDVAFSGRVTFGGPVVGPLVFEGATVDGNRTIFDVQDPTSVNTITLPDASGILLTTGNLQDITSATPFSGLSVTGDAVLDGDVVLGSSPSSRITINGVVQGLGLSFEGAVVDSYTTTLQFSEPTVNRVITFPDADGLVLVSDPSSDFVVAAKNINLQSGPESNFMQPGNTGQTVSGGANHHSMGNYTVVGGGHSNSAVANFCTVGGGENNVAGADYAFVGGGLGNLATGPYSAIIGGEDNIASGLHSFAAGKSARATHDGAFVFAAPNPGAPPFASTANNEFSVQAIGGVRFETAVGVGAVLASGSGTWASLSDRNAKTRFEEVDVRDVLDKVSRLPIQTWSYKGPEEQAGIRHMGPVAQDFYAAFQLGGDETRISTVDADGVALASVQALNEIIDSQSRRLQELEDMVAQQSLLIQALVQQQELKAAATAETDKR